MIRYIKFLICRNEELSIRKLTYNNPTMREKFEQARNANQAEVIDLRTNKDLKHKSKKRLPKLVRQPLLLCYPVKTRT